LKVLIIRPLANRKMARSLEGSPLRGGLNKRRENSIPLRRHGDDARVGVEDFQEARRWTVMSPYGGKKKTIRHRPAAILYATGNVGRAKRREKGREGPFRPGAHKRQVVIRRVEFGKGQVRKA